ncbi:DUF6270 domain-containing protein [Shimia thalassica]|uniref:DUF6270 domain-containing protein n=1 Tax=Shimia thalassica TaxID=1715693 RepID=UPI0026E2A2C2|nr:DUF6270 domain-containing protein [Shimia thalassica]MDO6799344.1 DUF6270 domain-containing protein [Shimia thalassica]
MTQFPVYILGSCATRDAFDYDFAKDFDLKSYLARTSFASLAGKPLVDTDILEGIQSSFQKRMVRADMDKSFLALAANYASGAVVIDLVDDRFRLNLFEDGASHTLSVEYGKVAKNARFKPERAVSNTSMAYRDLWAQGLAKVAAVLKANKGIKVYVNCLYFVFPQVPGPYDQEKIDQMNGYLAKAYDALERTFGEEAMIRYPADRITVDPDHKWGSAPFHYSEETYRYFVDELRRRMAANLAKSA